MDFKVQVEKLEGAVNWTKWRRQIELLLRHHDVLDVLTGNLSKPSPPSESATAEEQTAFEKTLKAFVKADALAQLILVGSMNDANIELTATCATAKTTWEKLLSIYEQTSGQRVDRLMELFFTNESVSATDDIATHIGRLQRNFHELNDELKRLAKAELPDLLLMSRILSTLPAEYFEFKSVWESVPVTERTVNKLTERLRLIEMRLPAKQSESTAFVAKSGVKKASHTEGERKAKYSPRCYRCQQIGHLARNCEKKTARASNSMGRSKSGSKPDRVGDAFVCSTIGVKEEELWLADSGASAHMTRNKNYFVTYEAFATPIAIQVGNSDVILGYGHGTVNVEMLIDGKWEQNHLTGVWYVPDVGKNLLSIGQTIGKGYNFTADQNGCSFMKGCRIKLNGKRTSKGLYTLNMRVCAPAKAAEVYSASEADTVQLWHERLCHQNKRHVKKVLENCGIKVNPSEEFCEGCVFGKQHRTSFGTRTNRSEKAGERIHADICGPMQEESVGGSKYFLCLKDDFSKFRRIFFLKSKAEAVNNIKAFLNEIKAAGHTVREFLCDGGREFDNADLRKALESRGINFRIIMPYTPEQNGAAEWENRTLVESARSMIHAKGLPIKLWAEAVNTAVHVLNRTGATTVKDTSPVELWFGHRPANIDHFRIFGTECYVHIPKQRRRKWDKKSVKGYFVGYCDEKDGYRIWIENQNKVVLSRDVVFKTEKTLQRKIGLIIEPADSVVEEACTELGKGETTRAESAEEAACDSEDENKGLTHRKSRQVRKPLYLNDYVMLAECEIPDSYAAAVASSEAEEWLHAMNDEMASLHENETWQLVDLPPGKKVISSRWVLRVKTKADGSIDRFKARLVAKGYSQKPGIDYDETFSPVARYDTVRAVLSVAASEKLHLVQFDVKTAFLYGKLQEEVFMKQPEGYDDKTGRVCRLNRSLYGLKQAPRCWNRRFVDFIQKQGMECSTADPCLFLRVENQKKLMIAIYVDDGLVAGSNENEIQQFMHELKNEFKITVGKIDCFLGMQINQLKDGSVFVTQSAYTKKVLKKFNMDDSNAVTTPCEKSGSCTGEGSPEVGSEVPYRQAVGSLMYLATATRPDLAYAVSMVSETLEHPKVSDWHAVKRIFKYLRGTVAYGLLYQAKCDSGELEGYSDADYAGDHKTRRSRTGVVLKHSGAAITWISQKQKSVVLSTTEAEYVAASEAAKEIIWVQRLLQEITDLKRTPVLLVDNASAVKLVKNPEFHKRSKHIEVRYHFVREKYQEGALIIDHIEGENQIADVMTKPLVPVRFKKLCNMLGLVSSDKVYLDRDKTVI